MLCLEPAPEVLEPLTKMLNECNFIVFMKARFRTKLILMNKDKTAIKELQKLLKSDI